MTDWSKVEQFADNGKKIQAIKAFREITGAGLRESKDAVESYMAQRRWPARYRDAATASSAAPPSEPEPATDTRLLAIEQELEQGRVIPAIKAMRELTGWGLKDSKQAVDHYRGSKTWPTRVRRLLVDSPNAASTTDVRALLEETMDEGRVIEALKLLRRATGWGLQESKHAVDHYRAHRTWTPEVLVALGVRHSTPTVVPSKPAPASRALPASRSVPPELFAAIDAEFSYRPEIRLVVPGRRGQVDGFLVLLGDRAGFWCRQGSGWREDLVLTYGEVDHVEANPEPGIDLELEMGSDRERFEGMQPDDIEQAMGLFRVLAP